MLVVKKKRAKKVRKVKNTNPAMCIGCQKKPARGPVTETQVINGIKTAVFGGCGINPNNYCGDNCEHQAYERKELADWMQ